MIMGFTYEYTYQDHEYIIGMNTMHIQCTSNTFGLQQNSIHVVFLLQAASVIALCCSEHICDQVA